MPVHLEVRDEIVMNREEADLHWELILKKCISIHTSTTTLQAEATFSCCRSSCFSHASSYHENVASARRVISYQGG